MTDYQRFTREEWLQVVNTSKDEYIKSLGGKPTRRKISNNIPDNHQLDALTRIAIIMLLVVSTFGVFKLGMTAYPLAESLVESNLHIPLPPMVEVLFKVSVITSAALGGVYGMIYFKLVSESSSTKRKIDASKRMKKYEVGWWSPRLPIFLVYATITIMFIVSNTANKTVFDWFFNNTIVLMELALSYPIALWMSKRQARREVIGTALTQALEEYERLVDNYETNPRYLRLLFQNASEAFFNLRASNRTYPNRELRNDDTGKVEEIIADEFRRMNAGVSFSEKVIANTFVQSKNVSNLQKQLKVYQNSGDGWQSKDIYGVNNTDKIHSSNLPTRENIYTENSASLYRAGAGAGETPSHPKQAGDGDPRQFSAGRVPPSGDYWTADTLYADLLMSQAPKSINEKYINEVYAGGHKAREVWRKSVRDQWNS